MVGMVREFACTDVAQYEVGQKLSADIFKDVNLVDVRAKTKGRGFTGVMKRHNFHGLRATHGVSVSHRSHGSTGQRQDPGKVFKGKKMAGHYGDAYRTVKNIKVVDIDVENNIIVLGGAVPGPRNGLVMIRKVEV